MDTCYSKRLEALRQILKQEGLEGYFQPYGDAYQNHFLPPSEERLAWLSGFTGSAGFAVVLMESAVVMSDGRYRVQLKKQIDSALYETGDFTKVSAGKWLAERAKSGAKIGYDPDLLTIAQIEKIEAALEGCSISAADGEESCRSPVGGGQAGKTNGACPDFSRKNSRTGYKSKNKQSIGSPFEKTKKRTFGGVYLNVSGFS